MFNTLPVFTYVNRLKVVSSEFYFHKPITVHIELYLLSFHTFFIVHRSVLTAENLKVKAQKSF